MPELRTHGDNQKGQRDDGEQVATSMTVWKQEDDQQWSKIEK